jgi:parallel beta-helix repeat protein
MKPQNVNRRTGLVKLSCVLFTAIAFLITSCKKDEMVTPASPAESVATGSAAANTTGTTATTGATTPTTTATTTAAASSASHTTGAATPTTPATTTSTATTTTSSSGYTASNIINLTSAHDMTISGKSIVGGSVPAITLTNCYNVHITQNLLSNSTDVGIYLYNCYNITVDYNNITNVATGVYVVNTTSGGIIVSNNQFRNMVGPFPRGQFVQFNTVSGANNAIANNKGENIFGASNPEDAINIYKSNGTASSPILITGNWIRGGGPSATGGGIMLGDNGGSFETASNNILVDPGQYGMAIAGGDHITITGNSIYGRSQSFTNIGLYIWGQRGAVCTNATISSNQVKFFNSSSQENDSWVGTGETTPAGWSSNTFGANISASILPATVVSF